jgi:heat shock protein HslJ
MKTHRSLEGDIADLLELSAPRREPDRLLENVLSTTGRVRPRPRWLTLLKEPPMRFHSSVTFGSPSARLGLVVSVAIALLLGIAGLVVAGASPQPGPIVKPTIVGSWRLESVTPSRGIAKQKDLEGYEIEMTFGADGTVFGYVGCTGFTTTYGIDGSALRFGPRSGIETSPKAGPGAGPCETDDVVAPLFFQMVEGLDRWAIEDDRLTLSTGEDGVPVVVLGSAASVGAPSASPVTTPFAISSFRSPFSVDGRLMETTWHEHVDRPNWVYLGWRPSSNEDDEGITFLYLDHLAVSPACGGAREDAPWEPTGDGPSAFVDWLREAGPVSVGPIEHVTIDGHEGLQFDVATEGLTECGGYLWITHTEPDNGFQLLPGWAVRVTALDVDGATVLAVVADAHAARFPDLAADADGLLASLSFD